MNTVLENFVKDFPEKDTKHIRYQVSLISNYIVGLKYLSAFDRIAALNEFKKSGKVIFRILGIRAVLRIDNFLLNYLKNKI